MGLIPQDYTVLEVSNLSSLNRQLGKRGYQNVNFIDTLTARTPAMGSVSKKLKQDISGGGGRAAPAGSFPKIAATTGNKVFRAGSLQKLDEGPLLLLGSPPVSVERIRSKTIAAEWMPNLHTPSPRLLFRLRRTSSERA